MTCTQCGAENREGARFCRMCADLLAPPRAGFPTIVDDYDDDQGEPAEHEGHPMRPMAEGLALALAALRGVDEQTLADIEELLAMVPADDGRPMLTPPIPPMPTGEE